MKNYQVTVNGVVYQVTVEELNSAPAANPVPLATPVAAPAAPKAAAPAAPAGGTSVAAPMPGTINKINFKAGDAVKRGDVLCVLEAMKMENEIPAPKDGKVAQVVVTKGATVGAGDTLVVLA